MKTTAIKEVYKVNGFTYSNYSDACQYIRTNNFRVTTTEVLNVKGLKVNVMHVTEMDSSIKPIDTAFLTDTQINRKVQASAKRWLKERNMNNVVISCIHGIFHATNAVSYSTTCKDILEQATGLQFKFISDGMSKRID